MSALVSIHAPAREATIRQKVATIEADVFQSTPPRGKRPAISSRMAATKGVFQSTPPRGKRPST